MAAKKVAPWAAKKGVKGAGKKVSQKKAAHKGKSAKRVEVAVSSVSLRQVAKQADIAVRRAGQAYVDKATEFEAARIEQREADRQLASFYAKAAAQGKRPFYSFLAQGDSWFNYTCGFALIHWLQERFGSDTAYFDNIAASGRTLRQMPSRQFKEELTVGPPDGQPWAAVLLSGGGNDICGDHRFRDWLEPYEGANSPPAAYITSAFDRELAILEGIYLEIIELVGKSSKTPRIFVHDYDFAIPDGRCVTGRSVQLERDAHFCFAGPWMWPAFEERGFHNPAGPISQLSKDIVTAILKRFSELLSRLEQKHPNQFVLVRTQGTLEPIQNPKHWANELHPYDDSFKVIAQPFFDKLRSYL